MSLRLAGRLAGSTSWPSGAGYCFPHSPCLPGSWGDVGRKQFSSEKKNSIEKSRERGHWAVYYTSPQSFLIRWFNNFKDFNEFLLVDSLS